MYLYATHSHSYARHSAAVYLLSILATLIVLSAENKSVVFIVPYVIHSLEFLQLHFVYFGWFDSAFRNK